MKALHADPCLQGHFYSILSSQFMHRIRLAEVTYCKQGPVSGALTRPLKRKLTYAQRGVLISRSHLNQKPRSIPKLVPERYVSLTPPRPPTIFSNKNLCRRECTSIFVSLHFGHNYAAHASLAFN